MKGTRETQVITKMKSQVFQFSHLQKVTTRGISVLVVKTCLFKKNTHESD